MIGDEFQHMSGPRIMAAAHLIECRQYDGDNDLRESEWTPADLQFDRTAWIKKCLRHGGIWRRKPRTYSRPKSIDEYGYDWPRLAIGDYYRCVHKRIDWKELAAARIKKARHLHFGVSNDDRIQQCEEPLAA